MTVRNATTDDIPCVVSMEKCFFSIPLSEDDLVSYLNDSLFRVCVAECNGEIAGYCVYYVVDTEASIISIATESRFRRQGIASALIGFIISEPVKVVHLEVRVSNTPAISLYDKLGFVNLGIRKNIYERPSEDGYIMELRP